MKRSPFKIVLVTILTLFTLPLLIITPAFAASTDGIVEVNFNGGSFANISDRKWVEKRSNGSVAFQFKEQNRTNSAILLFDESRSVHISLIIPANEILYSHKGEQFRILYKITHVQYAGGPSSIEPLNCGENYELRNGECHLVQNCGENAARNVEGDCHCNKNYELKNNHCVWKTDKNGFEIAPWEKPECKELDRLCKRGVDKACMQYEGICQVN